MTEQGFIEDFTDYTCEQMKTNRDWVETCVCSLVATAAGPKRYLSTQIGKLRLSIANIHIAGSAIGIKSPFLIYVLRPTLRHYSALMGYDYELPTKFTLEYMTKYLCSKDEKTGRLKNEGLIAQDEYTLGFKESKNKDYLTGTMEYISFLLDGYVPKTGTISRGEEFVKFCYVNLISCTTPYFGKLLAKSGDDFFVQGTGARPLWHVETKRKEITLEELGQFYYDTHHIEEREKKLKQFAKQLQTINREAPNVVIPYGIASDLLRKYRVDTMNRAIQTYNKDNLSPDVGVWGKVAANADKLAALRAISRYANPSPKLPHDHIPITDGDAKWAIKKANKCMESYSELQKLKDMFDEMESRYSIEKYKKRAIKIIRGCGGVATWSELLNKTGWTAEHLGKVVGALIAGGIFVREEFKTTKPGSRFRLVE